MPGPRDQPAAEIITARQPNRLARETSPYLLQHRLNPVDWFAWGDEAFVEARRREVPIFLSIGYSTCYWCHVMERESFESDAIAAIMNEHFVCIKVDREERPDVDDLYMAAVQAFTGHGGWPMSVFLDPATLKPFWAGTYFPAEARRGMGNMPTFPQVLGGIARTWREDRKTVEEQAGVLAEAVRERVVAATTPVAVDERQVTQAVAHLLRLHDRADGGFGTAPKFPQPVYLELLLSARIAAGDETTRGAIDAAVKRTLDRMALGGLFDQVGGGFHRYSVDGHWLVPHFEKMLYDNAGLAAVYAEAARVYGDAFYRRIARRTCEYVLRELRSPDGGFYSAQDAEVNHREGQNYLWTPADVRAALGPEDAAFALRVYQITEAGNFRDPHHPEDAPSNVLSLAERPADLARSMGLEEDAFLAQLDAVNARMLEARSRRDQPSTDTKVLAGWNGLMIAALARCGEVLDEPRFTAAATDAAECVLVRMRAPGGGLFRSFSQGRAQIPAVFEDYAMLVHGLAALHAAGADKGGAFLAAAGELAAEADARFGEPSTGAYFDTLAGQTDLFVRARSVYDGAIPSGTSVMINALLDVHAITGERAQLDRAARALAASSGYLAQAPLGAANTCRGLLRMLSIDRTALAAALGEASSATPPRDTAGDDHAVEILSPVQTVELAPGRPAGVVCRVRIAEGYHLTAANPGTSEAARDLVPFKVHIINGSGVAAYADYPKGEEFGEPGSRVNIYKGQFELTVVLERMGEWSGRPLLAVTYQACTGAACLRARTVELDIAIDRH